MKMLLTIPGGPEPFEVTCLESKLLNDLELVRIEDRSFAVPEYWLSPIPKRTERRVIFNRKKLCHILLDMGYNIDNEGNFYRQNRPSFLATMWNFCGYPLDSPDSLRCDGFNFLPEWTEEVEVDE